MFKINNAYDKYENKTFRLPKDMAETLAQIAFDNNLSMNKLVIQCLKYAMNHLEKPESKN